MAHGTGDRKHLAADRAGRRHTAAASARAVVTGTSLGVSSTTRAVSSGKSTATRAAGNHGTRLVDPPSATNGMQQSVAPPPEGCLSSRLWVAPLVRKGHDHMLRMSLRCAGIVNLSRFRATPVPKVGKKRSIGVSLAAYVDTLWYCYRKNCTEVESTSVLIH